MGKVKKRLKKFPSWTLTIVTLAAILWLTLSPRPLGEVEVRFFPGEDKVVHAIMFGFLVIMILIDRRRKNSSIREEERFAWFTFAGVSILGVVIEFLQEAMDMGRSLDVYDMAADAAGALLATLAWIGAIRFHK